MDDGEEYASAVRVLVRVVAPLACAIAIAGCWPWHHRGPTPQQQYLEAIEHGHSAEASQIWLQMSPEDREKWARSEGVSPQESPDQVKKQVMQHYQSEIEAGSGGNEIITPTPPQGGAGLENLPSYLNQPKAPPAAADTGGSQPN